MRITPILAATVLTMVMGGSAARAQVKIIGQSYLPPPIAPARAPIARAPIASARAPIAASGGARAKYEPAGDTVYHGASLPDAWSENGLRRQISDYNAAAGKKISVVTWFASAYEKGRMTNWRSSYSPNLERVKRLGAVSLIKFSTQDYVYDETKKMADLKSISRGTWDEYFKGAALAVKDFGGPVFISINHEMNGNWYPYSQSYPGSTTTAADFVAAWQRIVTIFNQNGAGNVAWVWSPNVPDVGGIGYASYYPGDEYVDWIGVSLYSGNDPTRDGRYLPASFPRANRFSSPNGQRRPKRTNSTRSSPAKSPGSSSFSRL